MNVGHFKNEHYDGGVLANSVDWRNKSGVLAEVQNQKQCGSCWAFSATSAVESGLAIHLNKPVVKLAEQELVDCEKTDDGCEGGLMDHAFAWLEKHNLVTEGKYPYTAKDGKCKLDVDTKEKVVVKG